jgi:hypothetical protein
MNIPKIDVYHVIICIIDEKGANQLLVYTSCSLQSTVSYHEICLPNLLGLVLGPI